MAAPATPVHMEEARSAVFNTGRRPRKFSLEVAFSIFHHSFS
jgi:hypothetical protein